MVLIGRNPSEQQYTESLISIDELRRKRYDVRRMAPELKYIFHMQGVMQCEEAIADLESKNVPCQFLRATLRDIESNL